ncbi:unnamed protein product [Urochloa humidicola]
MLILPATTNGGHLCWRLPMLAASAVKWVVPAQIVSGLVAAAVLFLASDDARYISGHNLLIDGGFSVVNPSFGIFKD